MTQVPPTTPPSLDDASAAAQARIDEALPPAATPGSPPAAPPADPGAEGGEPPFDLFADGALESLDFGNVPYRDGKKLENEIKSARDRYRPFNDAFGGMSDEARQELLDAAPTLGDDLSTLVANSARLHPDDRNWFVEVMNTMQRDPAAGAQMLQDGAAAIREQVGGATPPPPPAPGQQPMPEWAGQPGQPQQPAADDTPMSRAEVEQLFAERSQQAAFDRDVHDNEQAILAQAKDLGYDPNSNDPVEDARFAALIHVAGRPDVGGDLSKAHEIIGEQWRQKVIDEFVAGKSADAERPGAPAAAGVAPADTRDLETLVDGRQAMLNRLDATLGPDARRRSGD